MLIILVTVTTNLTSPHIHGRVKHQTISGHSQDHITHTTPPDSIANLLKQVNSVQLPMAPSTNIAGTRLSILVLIAQRARPLFTLLTLMMT